MTMICLLFIPPCRSYYLYLSRNTERNIFYAMELFNIFYIYLHFMRNPVTLYSLTLSVR